MGSTTILEVAMEVYDWAEQQFPARTDASMALKMYSEIGEMLESDGHPLEIADVFILLMDYAVRKNVNIEDAVLSKLEINKARTWEISPMGVMSHRKEDHDQN